MQVWRCGRGALYKYHVARFVRFQRTKQIYSRDFADDFLARHWLLSFSSWCASIAHDINAATVVQTILYVFKENNRRICEKLFSAPIYLRCVYATENVLHFSYFLLLYNLAAGRLQRFVSPDHIVKAIL
jgi:hypothetical protein